MTAAVTDRDAGAAPGGAAPAPARDIGVLLLASLLFSASFQLLTTIVPLRVVDLGGTGLEVGLITGVFAASSLVVRPLIGWQLDRSRRLPLVVLGASIFAVSSFGYSLVATVWALLVLRSLHGLGMATQTTASQTLIVDLAPPRQRGSVLGLLGACPSIAMGVGPAAGAALLAAAGYNPVFYLSCGLALLAIVASALVREPAPAPRSPGRGRWRLLHPAMVRPGIALVALQFGFGAAITFLPLLARERDLPNPGLFFTCYAVAVVISQTIGGRISDRASRMAVVIPGLAIAAAGLLCIATFPGWWLLVAGTVFGLGLGAAQPALLALAGDLVPASERGAAMASLGVFLELGIGGGATVTGALSATIGLGPAFIICAGVALAGAVVTQLMRSGMGGQPPAPARP